jgi:hypothetical protein
MDLKNIMFGGVDWIDLGLRLVTGFSERVSKTKNYIKEDIS